MTTNKAILAWHFLPQDGALQYFAASYAARAAERKAQERYLLKLIRAARKGL